MDIFFEHLINCGLSEEGTIGGTVELFKRPGEENTSFGFLWNPFQTGAAIITRIISDSPADRSEGRIQVNDQITAINGTNIIGRSTSEIQALILASGLSIALTIEGIILSKELNHFGGIASFFQDWAPWTLAGCK